MRRSAFCRSHQAAEDQPEDGALPEERRTREQAFARLVRDGRHSEVIEEALRAAIASAGGELSLGEEIGALRLMLRRVLAVDALDGDPRAVAQTLTRLVEAIVRAVRMQRTISGELSGGLSEALTQILTEIGLGDEP
jgi:hypothetical protein